ncbi:hypothetical protein C6P46_004881 [Rhodotorula mucilaginosa]|uniref:Uncharacterized protein n=1 Tax=Rhodotorula mucilaginosa TaxID=5537 RepID=A0A9P6W8W6_RHOMI|nr:hypothetical protein C6P46_004881 [Rhodotorula mucilaginosa]
MFARRALQAARPLARSFSVQQAARKGQSYALHSVWATCAFCRPAREVVGGSVLTWTRSDRSLPSCSSLPVNDHRDGGWGRSYTVSLLPLLTLSRCRAADFVQELYVKELRAYKPKPAASAQGATKSYSTPTAPKTPVVPDANQLAQELEAYDSCVHTCPLSLPDGSWILSLARNGVWFPRGFGWGMAASARTSGPLLTQRPSASKELDGVSGVWTGNVAGDGISGQRSEEQEPEDYQFWTRNATDSPNLFVSPSHPSFRSFLGLRPNPRPIPQLPVFFGVGSPPFPILKPPHDEPPTSRAVPVDTSSSSSAAVAAESVEEADALGADDYLKLCEQPVQAAKH